MTAATFLPVYFDKLDSGAFEDVVTMLAPEFTFSLLWATDDGAREFAGGLEEFHGYLEQRDPEGQLHHLGLSIREGQTEVASGWTTRHGTPLATFTFAVELDDDDRCKRLFAARTLAFDGRRF